MGEGCLLHQLTASQHPTRVKAMEHMHGGRSLLHVWFKPSWQLSTMNSGVNWQVVELSDMKISLWHVIK